MQNLRRRLQTEHFQQIRNNIPLRSGIWHGLHKHRRVVRKAALLAAQSAVRCRLHCLIGAQMFMARSWTFPLWLNYHSLLQILYFLCLSLHLTLRSFFCRRKFRNLFFTSQEIFSQLIDKLLILQILLDDLLQILVLLELNSVALIVEFRFRFLKFNISC